MQITIEGVVTSDALAEGEQRTVELTPYIRGLLRNRLVRQVPFDPPEVEATPAAVDELPPVIEDSAVVVDESDTSTEESAPKRRRRAPKPDPEPTEEE